MTPSEADASEKSGPPTPAELLRHALVNGDDARFPWWLPLPGVALAVVWAGWQAVSAIAGVGTPEVTAASVFLETLVWPGGGIFVLTTAATWAGWQLEID